ncbi:hypothetical protein phytr_10010 [Candidatus Phycorickettsia trachydisci]|uniref:AbiEi antitoxin C-terminal domain-containing protein n=1 Tax=Candidatus Phycorickettsia trachydisci TaxID=2115978 RepID=A0A2P1P9I1_9RICK|nr:type IV toxin-antitoxin system AbiEi family antitoxin [Candidatus Phycorickettsia trachydisci]AVP87929.1 hypothetical protein phytr_10010 [Candidatus Phycorickettsia trachydisci]
MFREYLDHLLSKGQSSFTFQEITNDLNLSINSTKSGLYRLKNKGQIITPAKGLYVIVPPERIHQGCIPAEELIPILMKYLRLDYYVSLLSAGLFHGATHQKPNCFQVVTNKQIKHPLKFGVVKLEMIYKKHLSNLPLQDFTVRTGYLKVASPELVIFDLFQYTSKSGGLNHIATVLSELILAVDPVKLIELANQIGQKAWLQRLGFILEQIESMEEDKKLKVIEVLEKYLDDKTTSFIPIAKEITTIGYPRIAKWKIIANTTIESDL